MHPLKFMQVVLAVLLTGNMKLHEIRFVGVRQTISFIFNAYVYKADPMQSGIIRKENGFSSKQ